MATITYQNNNILEDFYTDNAFNYILSTSFISNKHYFSDFTTYIKEYITNWIPILNNPQNRLAFNSGTMFEIAFYKNLILLIPLYISNYSIYEDNMLKIKNWCVQYIINENNKNDKLINTINYKLFIYTHVNNHTSIKVNILKTNKTILGTELYTYMYESLPIIITNNLYTASNPSNPYITYNPTLISPYTTNTPFIQNTFDTSDKMNIT